MHPEADELVYLLEGDADFLLEKPAGVETVRVQGRGLVIVHLEVLRRTPGPDEAAG